MCPIFLNHHEMKQEEWMYNMPRSFSDDEVKEVV